MKTYEWMAGARGLAHFCERGEVGSARPVCGKILTDLMPVAGEKPRCPACVKASGVILRYAEVMSQAKPGRDGGQGSSETK